MQITFYIFYELDINSLFLELMMHYLLVLLILKNKLGAYLGIFESILKQYTCIVDTLFFLNIRYKFLNS